jgi:hypothetical protein
MCPEPKNLAEISASSIIVSLCFTDLNNGETSCACSTVYNGSAICVLLFSLLALSASSSGF